MADGPERHPILAADADRERSVALLREAVGEGRLTLDEFSDRVAQAQVARTEQDLIKLFGTVTVIVPEGIAVDIEGGGMFASQKIDSPQAPPMPGAPRLRIVVSGPGGTLHVRSQPARKSLLGSVGQ
ncbi:MAG: DUF1707 domain-containing protein [Actinomycetota bacterium]|nr:DUF1707 domain-containing protein [Actinomycetota bacterium]